jgi:WD40 repeat protein
MACGPLTFTQTIALGPSAVGQNYVRCQTLGPETGWQVTLSPAGDRLAARTAAGTVRLLATNPWSEIVQVGAPLGQIDAVAFSPDGLTLAALSAEMGEVTLWNTVDGSLARSFAGPPASGVDTTASTLAFSADGSRLATSLGTIIDLKAGTTTSWLTGAPGSFALANNPESLAFSSPAGGGIPVMRFTAGDAQLFVETDFQVGNSPTSTRLELRAPATGAQIVLYNFFTRGLLGYAVSPDGRFIARATTAEAGSVAGFAAGLTIFDATTGGQVAFDASFTGSVLGFSRDGSEIFTETGTTVTGAGSTDLHIINQFAVPAGFAFLGVSPAGDLVGAVANATSWLSPTTGTVVQTSPYPLGALTWSGDGRFGAGTGDPAALFHFWREAGDTQLCGLAADTTTAPALTSLGTPGPGEGLSVTSADGSLTVSSAMVVHTHAVNYDALSVHDTATGALLRQFGATVGTPPIAISTPAGAKLYTPVGNDIAAWCR